MHLVQFAGANLMRTEEQGGEGQTKNEHTKTESRTGQLIYTMGFFKMRSIPATQGISAVLVCTPLVSQRLKRHVVNFDR